jgi:hypothetical protein
MLNTLSTETEWDMATPRLVRTQPVVKTFGLVVTSHCGFSLKQNEIWSCDAKSLQHRRLWYNSLYLRRQIPVFFQYADSTVFYSGDGSSRFFRKLVLPIYETISLGIPEVSSGPPLWSSGQSSWLQNGDVLCFLWGTNWIYICYAEESIPPLWSSGQSSWLQIQRSEFDSRRYQIFW